MSTNNYLPFASDDAPRPREAQSLIRQMWDSRPVRIPSEQGGNAKIAGVCEGIGVRYQIDPVLIRLVFVVLGVFGGGISLYLLAWLLMPRYSLSVSPLEAIWTPGHPKDRTTGWWLLIFFLIFSGIIGSSFSDFYSSTSVLSYILFAAMIYGLHKRQPTPPLGLLTSEKDNTMNSQEFDPTSYPQPQPDLSNISPVDGYAAPFAQQHADAPTWDPLTSQNYAWNAPVSPMSYAPDKPKRKPKVWPWVIMGFAAFGTVALIVSGLVGSLFYFANEPVDSEDSARVGLGEGNYAPTNDTLQDAYSSGVGEVNLDLSKLTPLDSAHTIDITSGVGEINVTLPDTVPVELRCSTGIGTANCDSGTYNADAEGEPLQIEVTSGIGDVNVDFAQE